jgi:hypothetical protein
VVSTSSRPSNCTLAFSSRIRGRAAICRIQALAEPLKFSPEGRFLAVGSQEGTTKVRTSPLFHDHGNLQVFAMQGTHLQHVANAPIGGWAEGVVWSRDGRTIMVQNDLERTISVFRFDGEKLTPGPMLHPNGGPVAFGTA